jgi:hypothetical protein
MYDVAYNYMFIHDLYTILGWISHISDNFIYLFIYLLVGLIYFINI